MGGGGGKGGGKGKGKGSPDYGEIRQWSIEMADANWAALSAGGIFAILFSIVSIIRWIISTLNIIYNWIKPAITLIIDFINKTLIPIINRINFWITSFKNIILITQGKLDQVIEDLYKKVFPELEDLRKTIQDTFTKVIDIVSVFSKEAADKLQATKDELLRTIDKYTRDVRDQLIDYVHQYTAPVLSKINEILIIIDTTKRDLLSRIAPLEKILEITFEKPQTLKREILFTTSMHWGVDLWNDLFSGVTPKEPVTPSLEMVQLQVDPVVDKYIQDIFAEKNVEWQDITQRVDEEIREKFYGEVISRKTEIKTVKLAAGAGGGF